MLQKARRVRFNKPSGSQQSLPTSDNLPLLAAGRDLVHKRGEGGWATQGWSSLWCVTDVPGYNT